MTERCFFISDLHLDESRPYVTAALAEFLDQRRDAAALYILGDLFEFWIGDDDNTAIATEVTRLLADYRQSGPKVYVMHGNRDFLLGEGFASMIGAELLPDPSVIEIDGSRLLLMHGDSLCTRDTEYQAFRAVARDPNWQASILAQSLEARRELAENLRKSSQDAGSRKADDIMDVTNSEVLKSMEAARSTTLIHGHTHRPAMHDEAAGTRWVLGDWDKTGWYIELEDGNIKLIEFDINQ
ncbi:UDP-2,3-diacylglucosamine diphosphatase [Congregibacter brevis]|uniref:UDP-2,3-diacylglucosamine hydrolase n=1 Tax=Congregibacter brevis TaxID=3081201 RepID=A0ABZ0IA78_9GAMM|nr:UDP-2,3-diacylglucosamine diphosphatase [Congregibacter sp. IMCC45268]